MAASAANPVNCFSGLSIRRLAPPTKVQQNQRIQSHHGQSSGLWGYRHSVCSWRFCKNVVAPPSNLPARSGGAVALKRSPTASSRPISKELGVPRVHDSISISSNSFESLESTATTIGVPCRRAVCISVSTHAELSELVVSSTNRMSDDSRATATSAKSRSPSRRSPPASHTWKRRDIANRTRAAKRISREEYEMKASGTFSGKVRASNPAGYLQWSLSDPAVRCRRIRRTPTVGPWLTGVGTSLGGCQCLVYCSRVPGASCRYLVQLALVHHPRATRLESAGPSSSSDADRYGRRHSAVP